MRSPVSHVVSAAAVCVVLVACNSSPKDSDSSVATTPSAVPAAPRAKPDFVQRPSDGTPLRTFVRNELQRGAAEHRTVLVYVGASWCEPCERFRAAVHGGELDRELDGVRFLELDHDRDEAELAEAGYASRLVPLIEVPKADGGGSGMRIEGSIKGPTAVRENLLPRLRVLLERAAR